MFSGIIESSCLVKAVRQTSGGLILQVDLGKLAPDVKIGDSMAINGICLTLARLESSIAEFDVSSETLSKSTLGNLRQAGTVNVERAVKADGRFGGHFVQGHVDGTATIREIRKKGQFVEMSFSLENRLLDEMVPQGSVAVDGISLTVADMDESGFSVVLIPLTLSQTTLGKAKTGDEVNIETDIIAKIVRRQFDKILARGKALTVERLKELGF